jgi:hypothetical protein
MNPIFVPLISICLLGEINVISSETLSFEFVELSTPLIGEDRLNNGKSFNFRGRGDGEFRSWN